MSARLELEPAVRLVGAPLIASSAAEHYTLCLGIRLPRQCVPPAQDLSVLCLAHAVWQTCIQTTSNPAGKLLKCRRLKPYGWASGRVEWLRWTAPSEQPAQRGLGVH